jgi:transcriptional regulator with XRE-family HTH domain
MTRLAEWRKRRGVSQDDMAAAIGISRTTYQKLESGDDINPRLGYLINCALALDCDPYELIEDEWFAWTIFDERKPRPPKPERFWRNHE